MTLVLEKRFVTFKVKSVFAAASDGNKKHHKQSQTSTEINSEICRTYSLHAVLEIVLRVARRRTDSDMFLQRLCQRCQKPFTTVPSHIKLITTEQYLSS